MGNHMSSKPPETPPPPPINFNHNLQYTTELSSYELACKLDEDLQSFDTSLQARTNQVISTLANGVEVRAVSFDSLKEVTECLLQMNQEVVKVILECKKDIWKNQELFELVEERARVEGNRYDRTLEELATFKAAGDPFTEEFILIFQSVYRQQMVMLDKLQNRRKKLDKKLKSIYAWRKVSSIIFAATFATVLICSVVAAAMAAPPVAAALAAATSIPLGSMGKWIDSLWKNYENAVKGQKEVISSMQAGTYVAIKDLDNIRILIDRLVIDIKSLLDNADFAIQEEAVKVGIEEIRKKLGGFKENVEALGVQADMCSRDIRRARTVILQRIIKHPNH
ncbi:transmembrane protein, putative [Actinidia rufa]|uniref:Transmembrane protein, putative n=1 Tax=Actinidia rufa TaxID=165716 RepID=A0A7J0FAZ9_9ERIC|nr:transmembrane protein, putative [Actinidia rufa]